MKKSEKFCNKQLYAESKASITGSATNDKETRVS